MTAVFLVWSWLDGQTKTTHRQRSDTGGRHHRHRYHGKRTCSVASLLVVVGFYSFPTPVIVVCSAVVLLLDRKRDLDRQDLTVVMRSDSFYELSTYIRYDRLPTS